MLKTRAKNFSTEAGQFARKGRSQRENAFSTKRSVQNCGKWGKPSTYAYFPVEKPMEKEISAEKRSEKQSKKRLQKNVKQCFELVFYLSFAKIPPMTSENDQRIGKGVQILDFFARFSYFSLLSTLFSEFSAFSFRSFQCFPHCLNKKWKTRKTRRGKL